MRTLKLFIASFLWATVLCSAAWAHHWVCEFCGYGVDANNMPQPGSCQKSPYRKSHSWLLDDGDGRSHNWICAFCGAGVNSSHRPHPSNSCTKNPSGKYHQWIRND